MLGPSILFASAPLSLSEGIRAVRVRGERILGGIALLAAVPAMAFVVASVWFGFSTVYE